MTQFEFLEAILQQSFADRDFVIPCCFVLTPVPVCDRRMDRRTDVHLCHR